MVFDLSFSMSLHDMGQSGSRLSRSQKALEGVLGSRNAKKNGEEWALVLFDDVGSAAVKVPFTQKTASIVDALAETNAWGLTPLQEALRISTNYILNEGTGRQAFVLLVSDCVNTVGELLSLPDMPEFAAERITLVVLHSGLPENGVALQGINQWIENNRGILIPVKEAHLLAGIFDHPSGVQRTRQIEIPALPVIVDQEPINDQDRTVVLSPWWIFGTLFLLLLAPTVVFALMWRRNLIAAKNFEGRRVQELRIQVSQAKKENQEYLFDTFPVKIAEDKRADLYLPKAKNSGSAKRFSIELEHEDAVFRAKGSFTINGVGRSQRVLKNGDRIVFGSYRIDFLGLRVRREPPPPLPRPLFLSLLPALLILIFLGIFVKRPIFVGIPQGEQAEQFQIPHEGLLGAAGTAHSAGGVKPLQSFAGKTETMRHTGSFGPFVDTVVWAPGDRPEFINADILFIHAHPDDESIDFGGLMSRASRSGKRVVAVLMTDGESGIDQYPRRIVDSVYPPYDLAGSALSAVRAGEARSALSVLGAEHYVRIGLKNNPYGSGDDVLSVSRVIDLWGGERELVKKVSDLILGYTPDLVVFPDGPSGALEHFEHEATGMIVKKALDNLREQNAKMPFGELHSIDPLQKDTYKDIYPVNVMVHDPDSGRPFRVIQAEALLQYHTQRDASVIGVENLLNYQSEFYRIVSWEHEVSLEGYLRTKP